MITTRDIKHDRKTSSEEDRRGRPCSLGAATCASINLTHACDSPWVASPAESAVESTKEAHPAGESHGQASMPLRMLRPLDVNRLLIPWDPSGMH